ncbi:MAG: isopentenyl phosphate kinase [Candidatus Bathyarchaeia archaeon]
MSSEPPLIVKLGGSVVTRKSQFMTADEAAITRLAREIKESNVPHLVLVHGGGSFGHPLAIEYALKEGLAEERQLMGFALTHQAMTRLNTLVVESLTSEGVPAVSIRPSAFLTTEGGRVKAVDLEPLRRLLSLGLTPVLCGDVVADRQLGFTVLSGDQLCSRLALELGSRRAILGVDVDGLYTADPKIDRTAQLLRHVTSTELRSLLDEARTNRGNDVTGGMTGKMREMLVFVENGGTVLVVNAAQADRLRKALKGEDFYGTRISSG